MSWLRAIPPAGWAAALAVIAALMAAGCGPATGLPTPEAITYVTEDGAGISGILFPVAEAQPPGLLLIHGLGGSKESWTRFARRAQQAGFQSLAIDLRGHGDSRPPPELDFDYGKARDEDWDAVMPDIEEGLRALAAHGADENNLAILGESLGGNLALRYAVDDWAVQTVVMISPGLEYRGVKAEEALAALGKRPVLLMTSTGDAYSASSALALEDLAPAQCEVREYRGAAHGAALFDQSPSAIEQCLLWLEQIVGTETVELETGAPYGVETPAGPRPAGE